MRVPQWRLELLLAAALLLPIALHLIRPDARENAYAVPLGAGITYAFNVDSWDFAQYVVAFPGRLAEDHGRTRRLRPLYIELAWLVYQPLRPLAGLVPDRLAASVEWRVRNNRNPSDFTRTVDVREMIVAWAALVASNLLVYWVSLVLIFHALSPAFGRRLAFALTLIPLVHTDTVSYVIVPHTECFNLLIPALFLRALADWQAGREGLGAACVAGAAMLAKGMPYVLLNWLVELVILRRRLAAAAAAAALILAPAALYLYSLKANGLPTESVEVSHYRQFVWLADYVREGNTRLIPVRLASDLLTNVKLTVVAFAWVLAVAAVLLVRRRVGDYRLPRQVLLHLCVYGAACLAFWALAGFFASRLTITHYPVFVYGLGALAAARSRRPEFWAAGAVLLGVVFWFF